MINTIPQIDIEPEFRTIDRLSRNDFTLTLAYDGVDSYRVTLTIATWSSPHTVNHYCDGSAEDNGAQARSRFTELAYRHDLVQLDWVELSY